MKRLNVRGLDPSGAPGEIAKINAAGDAVEFGQLEPADIPDSELDDLTDVDLTAAAPVEGQALVFDGTKWIPSTNIIVLNPGQNTLPSGSLGNSLVVRRTS